MSALWRCLADWAVPDRALLAIGYVPGVAR